MALQNSGERSILKQLDSYKNICKDKNETISLPHVKHKDQLQVDIAKCESQKTVKFLKIDKREYLYDLKFGKDPINSKQKAQITQKILINWHSEIFYHISTLTK